jgi:acyl dehydratase
MLKTATLKTIRGAAELSAAVREELGISRWYQVSQDRIKLNFGYDRVRFRAPVPADGRVRMRLQLLADADAPGSRRATFDRAHEATPVCIASRILRLETS